MMSLLRRAGSSRSSFGSLSTARAASSTWRRRLHAGPRGRQTCTSDGPIPLISVHAAMQAMVMTLTLGAVAALHAPASARYLRPAQPRLRTATRLAVTAEPLLRTAVIPATHVAHQLSGLGGQALAVEASDVPTKGEFRAAIPAHCFKKNTIRSLAHAFQSVTCTAACAALAPLIPLRWAFAPVWLAYGAATGTVATGMWVIAHECGHGAFSDNRRLQDAVGYFLHSLMLVPYFSWQVHKTPGQRSSRRARSPLSSHLNEPVATCPSARYSEIGSAPPLTAALARGASRAHEPHHQRRDARARRDQRRWRPTVVQEHTSSLLFFLLLPRTSRPTGQRVFKCPSPRGRAAACRSCLATLTLTHSPTVEGIECGGAEGALTVASTLRRTGHGVYNLFLHLVIGWPAYLLWGATGEYHAEMTCTAHPDLLWRAGPCLCRGPADLCIIRRTYLPAGGSCIRTF